MNSSGEHTCVPPPLEVAKLNLIIFVSYVHTCTCTIAILIFNYSFISHLRETSLITA